MHSPACGDGGVQAEGQTWSCAAVVHSSWQQKLSLPTAGDAGGGLEGQQARRKMLRKLAALGQFLGGSSRLYDSIY